MHCLKINSLTRNFALYEGEILTVVLQYSSFRGYRHASFKSLITVNPLISPLFSRRKLVSSPLLSPPPPPLFYFISSAKKQTNKPTNRKKERWQGHRNSCGELHQARILIKKKTRNIKKDSDTRKTTATYNKLLDQTRDEYERTCVFTIIRNS